MAVKTHSWISLWFLLTVPVIAWDVGYCFMRPRSMRGGDWHWLWKPYSLYQDPGPERRTLIDVRVARPSIWQRLYQRSMYDIFHSFASSPSDSQPALLNVIETLLNITYLYFAHVAAWPPATLIGFASANLTLAKTVLYWLQEYYCGFCGIGHNSASTLFIYWIIPNGLWIVVPAIIVARLGKDLAQSLNFAAKASVTKKQK
ncbi:hypothetical protein D9615_005623 [Tricholomella constricta]|uniref:EXPERA domain-containing protein n=1 Tax=Tricholomella constricta TaxID=117010 RepID=A0A8H5HEE2_9AGAR|nr:hypothetical protein D9615_005623 [Tricholomella constricta]